MAEAAQRRLAAILAADVVGYSRLMEGAEAATLARLKSLRAELVDPLVAAHGGRLIKLMDDGALVEFPSVTAAVECAIAIQQGMATREAGRAEVDAIRFRIGINLGDVLVDGNDLYGDSVNIAARLEDLADAGGVVLSAAAFDQVSGKLPVAFRDLGERTLKNMARPVRVYALGKALTSLPRRHRRHGLAALVALIACGGVAGVWWWRDAAAPVESRSIVAPAERPAVAVMPFTNLADPADSTFGDGLTEDIAATLARFGELAVIDPAATRDRRAAGDSAAAGRELGARYLVGGTVRRDGSRVRVTAQLVEAETAAILWSQRYDAALADIFKVQDDITRELASALAVRLDQLEQQRIAARPPESLEVYELVHLGRKLLSKGTRAGNREARQVLAEAVAKDPSYGPAQAALGTALFDLAINGWTEFPQEALAQAEQAAHAALSVDPDLASASRLLGQIFITRRQLSLALAVIDRALAANPSDARSYEIRGDVLMWSGDQPAAAATLEAAQRLNPSLGHLDLGIVYYLLGRYDDASAMLTRGLPSLRLPADRAAAASVLAASYAQPGDDAAARTRTELAKVAPFFDQEFFLSLFRLESDRAHLRDGFAKAGITG
jgi:class 3 adenylate cyclase/TolB-like protein/Tfp pilus assembly protein PilF